MDRARATTATVRLFLGLIVLAALSARLSRSPAALHPAATAEPAKAEPAPADPLADLNKVFRAAYAKARQEVIRQSGPVILTEGDDLVLLRNGRRTKIRVVPDKYHTLKAVAHIPLTVYAYLAPYGEGDLSEQRLKDLQSYRGRLDGVFQAVAGHVPEADLDRQRQIIDAARQFLDGVLERKSIKAGELTAYTRKMGPLVLANAAAAARAELDALHKQVLAWKAEMTPEEWDRLNVVIIGSAMPRKSNLDTQYFARLLGQPGEGPRIIYAEGLFEEPRALNLLGTHRFDTAIGSAFFDDKARMHRDLLGDAAAEYLKAMTFER